MADSSSKKIKLLYLMKMFMEMSDEDHGVSRSDIEIYFSRYDMTFDRKTLYSDIDVLRDFGMDIEGRQIDGTFKYFLLSRDFDLAELKLLVDVIQSSKFITVQKSRDLIKKIEGFASKYEASNLQRHIYVNNRAKTDNEAILYTVDTIHSAINVNRKIKFKYFNWNVKKEKEYKHNGKFYEVAPYGLCYDDDNYYMVGYEAAEGKIKNFRVDKMAACMVMWDDARDGDKVWNNQDLAEYAGKHFGFFGGKEYRVKLLVDNNLSGVIVDRFGKDVFMAPYDDKHFTAIVDVQVSKQFIGWVVGLGNGIKVVEPSDVVDMMKEEAKRLMDTYLGE